MLVDETPDYREWFEQRSKADKAQISARVIRIREHNHLGDTRYLGKGLAELRWKNGRRVYYAAIGKDSILFLIGGNKNGQKKDIEKARHILQKYTSD